MSKAFERSRRIPTENSPRSEGVPGRSVFAISAISSSVIVLKNIDCVKEPLRILRSEADDCIPLAKLRPILEK